MIGSLEIELRCRFQAPIMGARLPHPGRGKLRLFRGLGGFREVGEELASWRAAADES